eukprot:5712981-Lingulodinium_polyedra.AAC.1
MKKEATITVDMVDNLRGTIFKAAIAVPGSSILPGCRQITVQYGTMEIVGVEVQSMTMEVNLRLGVAMKFHAMATGQ